MLLALQATDTQPEVDRAAGFYGCLTHRRTGASSIGSALRFEQTLGYRPRVSLETPSWLLDLGLAPGVTMGSDTTGRVTVVLNGELFLDGCTDARAVAERYLRMGGEFARDLNGTFGLVLVDRVMDRVLLVTDRIASRRIFHGVTAGSHWIGSDLSVLPTDRFRIDPVGVAWYLSNGVPHAGRTPFEGLRSLTRGSIHEVSKSDVASTRYWDVGNHEAGIGARDAELEEELIRRLVVAIRRRVADRPDVYLSLSGGWDSAAMAGLLEGMVPASSVHTFSYVKGRAQPGSDPWVARELATALGFEHRMYQSYRGDLVDHVRRNARLGMGTAHPVDEVHAWDALERDASASPNAVLFVGDHYMGENPTRRVKAGGRPPGKLKEFHRLHWLAPYLGNSTYRRFVSGIRSDLDELAQAAGPNRHGGYYFIDQRLPNTLVPWRAQFPGRFMAVRWPLLDYDLLDWTQMISLDQRRSSIYQRTVERALPKVFQTPRAQTPGYQAHLGLESRSQAENLRQMLAKTDSRLDEALPSDLGGALIELVEREARLPGKIARRVRGSVSRAQIAARQKLGLFPIGASVGRARVLRNYLILREALTPRTRAG